jgi:hypothetical protein
MTVFSLDDASPEVNAVTTINQVHGALGRGTPKIGVIIDATAPLERVVDEILSKCRAGRPRGWNKGRL